MPSVHLQPEDREKIQKLVDRPPRLNARMKAVVLLDAETGARTSRSPGVWASPFRRWAMSSPPTSPEGWRPWA